MAEVRQRNVNRDEPKKTNSVSDSAGAQQNSEKDHGSSKKPTRPRQYRIYENKECPLVLLSESNPSFAAALNFFIIIGTLMCFLDVGLSSLDKGRFSIDLQPYITVFGSASDYVDIFRVWLVLFGVYLLVYPIFLIWSRLHGFLPLAFDVVFILLFSAYHVLTHKLVLRVAFVDNAPFVASCIVCIEQIRLSLKSYSFVRENAYKVLYPWKTTDKEGPPVWYKGQIKPELASFKQFMYFTFAPTFLYRDEYPRTARIRWTKVLWHLTEFLMSVFLCIMLGKNFLRPALELIPTNPPKYVLMSLIQFIFCGPFILLLMGMCIVQGWMNFTAELARFADRQFYGEWWLCVNFRSYFRKWSLVVHDWINSYIYEDIKNVVNSKTYNQFAPIPAIAASSLVHEYMIGVGTKFFIPSVSFFYVVLGGAVFFVSPKAHPFQWWNYWFLLGLSIGNGLMIYGYALEYYARAHCPIEPTLGNAFRLQFLTCYFGGGENP